MAHIHTKEAHSPTITTSEIMHFGVESLRRSASVGELFERAQSVATTFMEIAIGPLPIDGISSKVQQMLDPKNPAHTTKEHLLRAIELQDYEGIAEEDEYFTLLEAVSLRQQIARELIRQTIKKETTIPLTEVQKINIEFGTQIQDYFDRMDIKWRREIKQGEGFKRLQKLQEYYEATTTDNPKDPRYAFKTYFEPLIEGHGDFLYVIPQIVVSDEPEGKLVATTYTEFFDEEIFGVKDRDGNRSGGVANLLNEMLNRLSDPQLAEDPNTHGLIEVNSALLDVLIYKGHSAAKQEELGVRLDRAFVLDTSTNNTILFPPQEAYTDPWQMLVEMEYNIAIEDTRYQEKDKEAEDGLYALLSYFEENKDRFGKYSTLQQSLDVISKCKAKFYAMLRSGSSNGYKSMASNVPNRPAIRLLRTVIDKDHASFIEKAQMGIERAGYVFHDQQDPTGNTMTTFFSDVDLLTRNANVFVSNHEFGHNAAVVSDTITRLTSQLYANLEEAKSDVLGLIGGLQLFKGKRTNQQNFLAAVFMHNLRGLTRWQDRDDRAHFNGNVLIVSLMQEVGIVQSTENGWIFDPADEKIDLLLQEADAAFVEFCEVYEEQDSQKAQQMGQALKERRFGEDNVKALAMAAQIDISEPVLRHQAA